MKKALLVVLTADKVSYPAEGRFRFQHMQRRPILGTLYICSAINAKGVKCDFLDQAVNNFSLADLIDCISKDDYIFVGFYSQLLIKDKLIEYIKSIKDKCPVAKIIVGGPGYLCYEDFLENGCDIVCRSEAELTIGEILDYLQGKKSVEAIDGIIYKCNGNIIYNRDRALAGNLDSISFPAWDKIDLNLYYDYYILPMKRPFAVMTTSRGCPFRCAFCSSPYLWANKYRVRSVKNVLEEIDILVEKHRIRYIVFQDDVFGIDNNWLKDFCHSLIDRRHNRLHWMCMLHPLTFKHDPYQLIRLMKRAGCNLFIFGLQATNPVVLEKINRNPDEPKVLKNIIKIATSLGIMTSVDFICGLPAETEATIYENINFALEAKPHLVNFHPLRLEPGSLLKKDYKDRDICKFNSDELREFCLQANREFYFKIKNSMRILKLICQENPFLIFQILKFYAPLKKTLSR